MGGIVFMGYYGVVVFGLEWFSPGNVERVWNSGALSGVLVGPIPLEESAFAIAFGMCWSGVYGHYAWRRPASKLDTVGRVSKC